MHHSGIALVWSPRLSFPCWEVYPALAVRLELWVTCSLTASSFIFLPPYLCPFFSHYFLFLRSITHENHKTNHKKKKMAFLWMLKLVYLFLGLFRAEIRHWCKYGSSTSNEKHAYYFFLKYIYSYHLFQFLAPHSPKSLSGPGLWFGSMKRGFTVGVVVHLVLHQH